MFVFLTILLFFIAVALIALVLIQPDRSQGLASSFGAGASSSLFGVSSDGGALAKITAWIATFFIILSMILYILSARGIF